MIHIATVHWLDDLWVDIQLSYFEKYLPVGEFRVYSFLNGIDPAPYKDRIFSIRTDPIQAHVTKLNLLAKEICTEAHADDVIYFIDGDAFPVGDVHSFVTEKLEKFPLVAVQRLENEGDPQPHPSFCATTVRFWKQIAGDWGQGPSWDTATGGRRTDVGALLWEKLKMSGIEWWPMLRSNATELHPLWFGVYQDLIYHHGAAFRTPYCRVDIKNARKRLDKRILMDMADSKLGMIRGGWLQNALYSFVMKQQIQKVTQDSSRLIKAISQDYSFADRFRA